MKHKLILFFMLSAWVTSAQNRVVYQAAYWIRYYNQTQLTNKLVLHYNIDERRLVNPGRQFQLFTHLHLNYQPTTWLEIGAGGCFNWTNSSKSVDLRIPEWRPWQELTLTKKITSVFNFQLRYRLDERFTRNNDGFDLLAGYRYNWRHRFRPQLAYSFKSKDETKTYVIRVSDEVMINAGDVKDVFDQNRIYASFQYPLGKRWSIETGYLNQFQSRASDDGFYERHTVRISIHHKVDLRKSAKTE